MQMESTVMQSDKEVRAPGKEGGSSKSPTQVVRGIKHLSMEEEWDMLTTSSASASQSGEEQAEDACRLVHSPSPEPYGVPSSPTLSSASLASSSCIVERPHMEQATKSAAVAYDAALLQEWRHISGAATPSTQSESGVSELSEVSSNAFDPVFFPERNATPTLRRPQRHPSNRHEVQCQLCSEEIRGIRWMCHDCPSWNVCESCFAITAENEVHPIHTFIRVMSSTDIFKVQEDHVYDIEGMKGGYNESNTLVRQPIIHLDVQCSNCSSSIIGARYDCISSLCRFKSVSFCQDCEALPINCHPPSHPLVKFKLPKSFCTALALQAEIAQQSTEEKAEKGDATAEGDIRWLRETNKKMVGGRDEGSKALGRLFETPADIRYMRGPQSAAHACHPPSHSPSPITHKWPEWSHGAFAITDDAWQQRQEKAEEGDNFTEGDIDWRQENDRTMQQRGQEANEALDGLFHRLAEKALRERWPIEEDDVGQEMGGGQPPKAEPVPQNPIATEEGGEGSFHPVRTPVLRVANPDEDGAHPSKAPRLRYSQTGLLSHGRDQQASDQGSMRATPSDKSRAAASVSPGFTTQNRAASRYTAGAVQKAKGVEPRPEHEPDYTLEPPLDLYNFFSKP